GAKGRVATDQGASRTVRRREKVASGSRGYNREIAARSHRRAGIAGHGGKHSVPHREFVAYGYVAEGQRPKCAGRKRVDQFGSQLNHCDEAVRLLPEGGN